MDNYANSDPLKVAIVKDEDTMYANSHPYKVAVVEGSAGGEGRIVEELPEVGETGYIYLVLKEETEEGNIYDEWMWVLQEDGVTYGWEHIGATNEVTIVLYDETGQNTDGAMTQKAVTDALDEKESITITGDGAPTASTEAANVGQQYYDTTNEKMYYCSAIDTTTDPYTYTWVEMGDGFRKIITFTDASVLDSNNRYQFMETEPGWYLVDGDLTEDQVMWDLRLGESGQYTTNTVWSNAFYAHKYVIQCLGADRSSGYGGGVRYRIYPDKNETRYIYEGLDNSSKAIYRTGGLPLRSIFGVSTLYPAISSSGYELRGAIQTQPTSSGFQNHLSFCDTSGDSIGEIYANSNYPTQGIFLSFSGGSNYMNLSKDGIILTAGSTGDYVSGESRTITGLADPTESHGAATKNYVDNLVGDIETALNTINNGGN